MQLTASAEIDTYDPQVYVIQENTVTVSTLSTTPWPVRGQRPLGAPRAGREGVLGSANPGFGAVSCLSGVGEAGQRP